MDGDLRWENVPVLDPGQSRTFGFGVTVEGSTSIINDRYVVRCREGVVGVGEPVITNIGQGEGSSIYLPVVLRME